MSPHRARGRRPKSLGNTRERILSVALDLFSRQGFDRTSSNEIARAADIDPAMMCYYFESKEDLFYEAVQKTIFAQIEAALTGSGTSVTIGDRLLDRFLQLWDSEEHQAALIALFRAGISNDRIGRRLRFFFEEEMPSQLGHRIPKETAQFRVGLVVSHLIGLAVSRHILKLEAVKSASRESLVAAYGPAVTRLLRGPIS